MQNIITIEKLSKSYKLGSRESYYSLRDKISSFGNVSKRKPAQPEFWALKDLSFKVKQGEAVGIIGRNGAGKSTLLKILSQITPPTSGKINLKGRVASLLEVGTGFHPELTGRENIFLNGAILGMTQSEIKRKFDEIVDFAEISQFLDTPVKRYSSGMYVRLAFAVAAHLEPEILIVDEVLAVGDVSFQKKCLGKMDDIAKSHGRTVLFVSHNMAAIENLCQRCILLEKGRLEKIGKTSTVVKTYLEKTLPSVSSNLSTRLDRGGNGKAKFTYFALEDKKGNPVTALQSGQDCSIVCGFEAKKPLKNVSVSLAITDQLGYSLIHHRTNFTNQNFKELPLKGKIRCFFENIPLVAGNYNLGLNLESNGEVVDDPRIVGQITVESGDFFKTGHPGTPGHSPILLNGNWSVEEA